MVSIQEISRQQIIPKQFFEQILNDLKSARVVESKRGVVKVVERVTVAEMCERARKLEPEPISASDFVIGSNRESRPKLLRMTHAFGTDKACREHAAQI